MINREWQNKGDEHAIKCISWRWNGEQMNDSIFVSHFQMNQFVCVSNQMTNRNNDQNKQIDEMYRIWFMLKSQSKDLLLMICSMERSNSRVSNRFCHSLHRKRFYFISKIIYPHQHVTQRYMLDPMASTRFFFRRVLSFMFICAQRAREFQVQNIVHIECHWGRYIASAPEIQWENKNK